jgi:hypothetical protein
MHKTHADRGLVLVTVTIDEPADKAQALEVLREKGATGPNFLLTAAGQDERSLLDRLGYEVGGPLPHTVVFDRTGRRVWDSTSDPHAKSEKELEKLVEAELAK